MGELITRPAVRITVIYIIVAGLWVLLSDRWLAMLIGDEITFRAQSIKGGFFVLVTGALLYLLVKRSLHRIAKASLEDHLCKLPNRLAFTREKQRRCKLSAENRFSLTILDVDNFTDLNDELSHHQGDELLVLLSDRLVSLLGKDWYIARLGGDEFGLMSPLKADPVATIEKLNSVQLQVMRGSDQPLLRSQTISAGTSLFPDHGTDGMDLMRHADMALSLAKNRGRNQHLVYHEQFKRNLIERLSLLKDLRLACEQRKFTVVYQPQWSVSSRSWTGAEVLIRWNHPERGYVPPDLFIPLAEREGLITGITEFVVEQSLSELRAAGICRESLPCLSINLSHPVLVSRATMDRLFNLIQSQGDACPKIMMEITETAAMENLDATLEAMQWWRRESLAFSIDDFGTGYSSLARLKQMPIMELKIDRSFISDIPGNENDAVITKAILAIAKTLSLKVIAEGVETQDQADFLADHGCEVQQGYFFARPMPIDSLQKLILH